MVGSSITGTQANNREIAGSTMESGPEPETTWTTPWVWTGAPVFARNAYVRFRRTLLLGDDRALRLEIAADARYWLWVNGGFVGFGPVRSWPDHGFYDAHAIERYLRRGTNSIAVLINHWQSGNFQYVPAPAGLSVRILGASGDVIDETGPHWKSAVARTEVAQTPRISVQLGFEEQHDALAEDGWRQSGFDDSTWDAAIYAPEASRPLAGRDIPPLDGERVEPTAVVAVEDVRPTETVWNLSLKALFAPRDISSNFCFVRGFVVTCIHSERSQTVDFIRPHHHAGPFTVGADRYPAIELPSDRDVVEERVRLRRGWNQVVFPFPGYHDVLAGDLPAGGVHLPVFVLVVRAAKPLRWDCRGGRGGSGAAWAFAGPFPLGAAQRKAMQRQVDFPRVVQAEGFPPGATAAQARRCEQALGVNWARWRGEAWYRQLPATEVVTNDVFAQWCGDTVTARRELPSPDLPWQRRGGWIISPAADGQDVRVLLDFGRMLVGLLAFEIEAAAGVQLDWHGFEFIQPDGRHNLATGMNNTLRYTTRAGRQAFRSLLRRGMRYVWLVVRGARESVRLRQVSIEVSTYPQRRLGSFRSSDEQLNRIWQVGADTLRWCAEDTYTDCPTYEQTHWVGDARNEALVDWVVNGDARLWRRCLLQAGEGLKRLPLVPSHVPSTWENLLPAWSFLWMRSCREYLWWTGDKAGALEIFPWLERNVAGIEEHVNRDGLFQMQAWNMFDWAAMETPADGVVTHLNALAALALDDAAELAGWLGHAGQGKRWRTRARRLRRAVNEHLWDRNSQAYVDCLHQDGSVGRVRSQQTQVAALLSGVATGTRAARCREIVAEAPHDFVQAGSPFFVFFQLETLAEEKQSVRMLDTIREAWGYMLNEGATSFWELWSLTSGRLTRSHCHGWSSAPTYFLSTAVLGVTPGAPESREIHFAPRPGDLTCMSGRVPTAWGWVQVEGELEKGRWRFRISLPWECRLLVERGLSFDCDLDVIESESGTVVVPKWI